SAIIGPQNSTGIDDAGRCGRVCACRAAAVRRQAGNKLSFHDAMPSPHQPKHGPAINRPVDPTTPGVFDPNPVGGSSMRYARRLSFSMRWLPVALPLCAALAMGCHGQVGDVGDGGGQLGGMNGGDGGVAQPCTGMSDPRMVVAGQRIMMMTKPQLVNTVRY